MIDRELNYGRHILDKFTKRIAKYSFGKKKLNVLDIGAGKGDDLSICSENVEFSNLSALESYGPNLNILLQKGINAVSFNLEKDNFPYQAETFDLVMANQILEHCKEVFWIFHEVSKVLKVGGYFYIGVPNLASLHSRFLLLLGRQPTCIRMAGPHVRGFTKSDLMDFLNDVAPGLYSLEEFHGSNFYPFPPFLAKILASFFPNSAVSIFFILKKNNQYNSEFVKFPLGLETNFFVG